MLQLNERSWALCEQLIAHSAQYQVDVIDLPCGARVIDAGVKACGGLSAGAVLARICLADLAEVSLVPGPLHGLPNVQVTTDHPVLACLSSQYAGWHVKVEKYFAMGSGPMRAAAKHEKLFEQIGGTEDARRVVGVLETSQLPTDDVADLIASRCKITPNQIILAVAPTTSLAGTWQIVARSVETCLHKMHELKFDVRQVRSAQGCAPLPPPVPDTVAAIGRTNDAILYGSQVSLWVEAADEELSAVAGQIPSLSSKDYGIPFAELFRRVGGDFYQIDPMLFSPAQITLHNLKSGRSFTAGKTNFELLRRSLDQ